MTETKQKTKKISRRDAIKLLGAATGATILANLPSKWNTPEIASGVLPAHAQTSGPVFTISLASGAGSCPTSGSGLGMFVSILPATDLISMTYSITTNGNEMEVNGTPYLFTTPVPANITGTALTD